MLGIFDSGLGGLTVLKEIKKELPGYDFIYLGDTLHVPYGNRSDEAVYDLTKKACEYLFGKGCKLVILACNTASAKALRKLQQEWIKDEDRNVLGVVRPVVEEISILTQGRVGVIGTKGTVSSNVYEKELKGKGEKIKVFQQATPLLVPLIEEGWINKKETKSILRTYLKPLKVKKVDKLILGCTHYPLLLKQIRGIMGTQCHVPNPAEIVAKSLKAYIDRHPEYHLPQNKQEYYFVTDLNANFSKMAQRFLNEQVIIKKVDY